MEIYERKYDNPFKRDDLLKENKLLGDFDIVETIFEGCYSSERIGVKDGLQYLIIGIDVTGYNGGTRYIVNKLEEV